VTARLLAYPLQLRLTIMPPFLRASIVLAAATSIGCSAPVMDDVADASGAMTEGVVLVERTVTGDGATQTNVSAKFMRLSTPVDADLAERVVGSKLDVPAPGSCRPVTFGTASTVNGEASARNVLGSIELIDVGDVTLRAGAALMPLSVRAFPDVGDLVSGMFYTSRDAASDLPAGATYTLEGTGSGLVDRFTIDAEAPSALEDVRVSGAALADGIALDEGAPVTVVWRESGGPLDASSPASRGDLVLIDVSASSGASIRCSFRDSGKAVLPGWILRSTTLGALPATATVAVHRVRERAFASPGIDTGEVRFDLSVIGRVFVTSPPAARADPILVPLATRGAPQP
jgi:hypothetical protein